MDIKGIKDGAYRKIEQKRREKHAAIEKANDFFNGYQDGVDDFIKILEEYERQEVQTNKKEAQNNENTD